MAMSPSAAMFLLSLPPVRGLLALLFLIMLGAVPLQEGDLGIGARIGLLLVLLVLGTVAWVPTLNGFLRDVREPRQIAGAVVLAHRPRRLARVLSWTALAVAVLAGLSIGALVRFEAPEPVLVAWALSAVVAVPLASLLPRLSRWYADGAGLVAASPDGLRIVPARGEDGMLIPWERVGTVGSSRSASEALDLGVPVGLGRRVRWRPGAREAVSRWAAGGFAPTAAEVRRLRLDPRWSPDPAAARLARTGRAATISFQGWALSVVVLLGAGLLWAVASGTVAWWWLPVLGWAPLLGVVILAPRVLRLLRTDERHPAEVTVEGWVDHLHGQGLVRWDRIDRIEVLDGHTLVIARDGAAPFTDRDLGNRMNRRLIDATRRWPAWAQLPSAGPLFREIGPRHLPYPPRTGAYTLVEEAAQRGGVPVRMVT